MWSTGRVHGGKLTDGGGASDELRGAENVGLGGGESTEAVRSRLGRPSGPSSAPGPGETCTPASTSEMERLTLLREKSPVMLSRACTQTGSTLGDADGRRALQSHGRV